LLSEVSEVKIKNILKRGIYEIAKARAEHDAYAELCLRADKMNTGMTCGELQ
jgi:hypothetical protein